MVLVKSGVVCEGGTKVDSCVSAIVDRLPPE